MSDARLSVGAHLLLWVFPLLVTVAAVADGIREAVRTGGRR